MTVEDLVAKFKAIPPQTQKTILAVTLLSGMVGYGYFAFILKPNQAKIASLTADLDAQTKALDEAKKKAAQYDKFLREAAQVEADLRGIRERMPDEDEMPGYLESLDRAMKVCGLSFFSSTVPGKVIVSANYTYIPVTFTVTGDYHQIGKFLETVATLTRVVGISHISIKPNVIKVGVIPGSVVAELTLNAYVYLTDAAKAAAAKAGAPKK